MASGGSTGSYWQQCGSNRSPWGSTEGFIQAVYRAGTNAYEKPSRCPMMEGHLRCFRVLPGCEEGEGVMQGL
ncbi:hypothetical protein Rxycam_00591 [Rubrobacter xylanophilus DSM 9941]|nr:hypothetical protein Rxycam_00591 [Rubrobacter xylanophilus DSM 9941]